MVQGTGPDPRAWVLAMGDARLAQWLNIMFSDNAESNRSSCQNHCPSDCGPQKSRLFGWEPPAYHWDKGFGSGVNNWLVHIEGEGWCNNVTNCLGRKNTCLGSSKQMLKEIPFVWNSEQQAIT